MGTISDKLAYLQETKELIRQAIVSKGQSVSTTASFRSYANKIKAITTSVTHSPSISVSTAGKITATCGGTSATKQLTTQAAKTVTPGTSSQTAVSSGVYTTGAVTVAGDSDLVASNIKKGVSIFNVTGTYNPTPIIESCTVSFSTSGGNTICDFKTTQNVGQVLSLYAYLEDSSKTYNLLVTNYMSSSDSDTAFFYVGSGTNTLLKYTGGFGVSNSSVMTMVSHTFPGSSYSSIESHIIYIPA